ncbi:TIGR01777 family oxidoreductase [Ferrimonas marina]|uniref:TIGR01777 family protein n=1 Tax=Ferrimonas marina TaxID=299255 RepID=A0A1M5SH02_9GAMM|nr:TIGR01777 family oxidoreductase [Ferrimonas marina]SHH37781.1 hypothetical protein SAMN02745129_1999 [Ferrimonas marina]
MQILITGATGFIGSTLVARLSGHRLTILSRDPQRAQQQLGDQHRYLRALATLTDLNEYDAVINLAGEPIASGRWTASKKRAICDSRWEITKKLAALLENSTEPPKVWLNASAIGIYGPRDATPVDESTTLLPLDFAAQVCEHWETFAKRVEQHTRLCIIRIGLVLHPEGGALKKMLPPFRLGLGGPIGNGAQMMSWIHRDDLIGLMLHLLEHDSAAGIFNGTAPNPVSNRDFSSALGKALGRPAILPAPAWAMKAALGEMSELLLTGQAVLPRAVEASGYQFQYPELEAALANLFSR